MEQTSRVAGESGASPVSCILPTYNRRAFLPHAIDYFSRQDYPNRELVIVDDGSDLVHDLVPSDTHIRYIRLDRRHTIGAKRNLACREARGEIILHWDDDDWAAAWRISYQVAELERLKTAVCGLDRLFYYEPGTGQAWEYAYAQTGRTWVSGNTLCYRKSFWRTHPFPEIDVAEDARFVWQAAPHEVARLENSRFLVGLVHKDNVSPKVTTGCYWHPRPESEIQALLGPDFARYHPEKTTPRPKALVSASLGLGDILRVTPLVRVLDRLGYDVDLLIEPDHPETVGLIEGAPEIHHIYYRTSTRVHPPRERLQGLAEESYEVATFTAWSEPLHALVRARRKLVFDRSEWLREGDWCSVERIARSLGWQSDLPKPFALTSGRWFDLEPGTVALHAGCKPDWPWKKWHGFDELAALLPRVALVGTQSDLDNAQTYFRREFRWPAHARNYIGKLSLPDTAALLSQCAALVANDSGVMHLGAALGIPTLGIFGITSPGREVIPASNMIPVTKGLDCDSVCQAQSWGRRDCDRHLECLKSLTAHEVLERLNRIPSMDAGAPVRSGQEEAAMRKLGLAYHGHVFDASGYGSAARAYIHALHTAGIELSVYDLSSHPPQVSDELVESLLNRAIHVDFHLFHGIPHVWAHQAFRLSNAIAMTVWETDSMPTQWLNTLNHVLEVWLPCDFNVEAFSPHMEKPPAKMPHPVVSRNGNGAGFDPADFLRVTPEDFVVYSIFEWQDRKSPTEQMRCHLRAFQNEERAVLILKANPGAVEAAQRALSEAQREIPSRARVELRCEAWDERQIAALHRRGDCYLSLHRGEGWGYPLFEAACQGTPVVATGYSGPLEYLDAEHHQLVRCQLTPVRQSYMYYHSRMKWAQPDLDDAVARLRWVHDHRDEARQSASEAAARLRRRFSPEAIGKYAKARLMSLLERTDHQRWIEVRTFEAPQSIQPPVPIPAEWFDADYFEHGLKSNWRQGYGWKDFESLFRETAGFLAGIFPEARTYFDAGCAKGFLVRALREAGLEAWGCDFSAWAIDNSEAAARPYLACAPVESVAWEHDYDVLVAFHLLAHLNEEQIDAFLTRARPHVNTALLAVIPLFESEEARRRDTGDAAHITRHGRTWWHERFLAAGWRQDPLHKAMQQVCQRHSLPARMGWELFVYAQGL